MNGRKPMLSTEQANALRREYVKGLPVRLLARLYKMDPKTVRNYVSLTHKHPSVRLDRVA
jgi:hypothetical protein